MTIKKEPSGRRSIEVEFDVPGTPEEVWHAIATGPGISSWFVPAEIEERDGKPVSMKLKFGPDMEPTSTVTGWDPPRMFSSLNESWAGAPRLATEWNIEARAGGVCRVRVVQSMFASTDEWDDQLAEASAAFSGFFRTLQLYLTHFRGQRSALHSVCGSRRGHGSRSVGKAHQCAGRERRNRWSAVDGARRRSRAQRRGGVLQADSIRRTAAPRQTGPGLSRSWRLQLSGRRPDHGCDWLLHLWRSRGRNHRSGGTALGSVGSKTLSARTVSCNEFHFLRS